jgi:hypothetical protein
MALVAIHAVVHVSVDVAMIPIRVRLRVAVRALEDTVISRIRVAGGADSVRVAVIHGEPSVIESGSQPTGSRVASGAACWESCRHVIRTIRSLVLRPVTAETVGRDCGVVVVHVTACTCHGRVLAR